jgi:hypothetical protein
MSGVRKSDHPERRKLAMMRRADTESGSPHNIGGVKRRTKERTKPSLPQVSFCSRCGGRDPDCYICKDSLAP